MGFYGMGFTVYFTKVRALFHRLDYGICLSDSSKRGIYLVLANTFKNYL